VDRLALAGVGGFALFLLLDAGPLVGLIHGFFLGDAVAFLDAADELVLFASDLIEVTVGELAPGWEWWDSLEGASGAGMWLSRQETSACCGRAGFWWALGLVPIEGGLAVSVGEGALGRARFAGVGGVGGAGAVGEGEIVWGGSRS